MRTVRKEGTVAPEELGDGLARGSHAPPLQAAQIWAMVSLEGPELVTQFA